MCVCVCQSVLSVCFPLPHALFTSISRLAGHGVWGAAMWGGRGEAGEAAHAHTSRVTAGYGLSGGWLIQRQPAASSALCLVARDVAAVCARAAGHD